MELSILVAKILAIIYIAIGIAAVSGKINLSKMVEDFENSSALTFIAGVIDLIIGMLLIEYHNIWVKDWTVLITITGWAFLLGGFILVAFPQSISYAKSMYKNTRAWGIFAIVVGLIFGYFGFVI